MSLTVVSKAEYYNQVSSSADKKGKTVEIFRGLLPTYIGFCEKKHGNQPYVVFYENGFGYFFRTGQEPWHYPLSKLSLAGIHIPMDWYLL